MLLAALAIGTTRLSAQGVTTGAIGGVVTGDQGQAVDNAQVRVTNRTTGFSHGVSTHSDGRYTVPGLEVGDYSVTVRRLGFQPVTQAATVSLGQLTRVDFQLKPQATQLTGVTVTAETQGASSIISPTHTGVVSTVTDSALRRLPSLNRNFTDFVALTPQVSTTGPGLSGGGTNNRYNNVQIDGATEADIFGLGSTGQPGGQANGKSIGIEAVKEYQVLLAPYDVRQGYFAGATINAVTKSGTNELHGSAFGTTRNASLARHGDQAPWVNKYDKSQYGFSLGGPIIKDKVLFFVSPEWQQNSTPAAGPYVGSSDARVTSSDIEAVRSGMQKYGITPGTGALINNQNPLTNTFARLDVSLPWNTQLVLHYNYGFAQQDIFGRSPTGFQLSDNGYKFTSKKNGTVAQLRTLFGNGAFNELFANYTGIRDRRAPNSRFPQVSVQNVGAGLYTVVGGAERFSQGNELDQDIVEVTDNVTLPVGAHRFTIGTQNQFTRFRNLFTQASYGVWQFGSVDSLNLGLPNQYIVGVPSPGGAAVKFRGNLYSLYAEDEWTATNRLNVTYGLRADVPVFVNKPATNAEVLQDYGRNTADIPSGNVEWSPRVGFNYDATGDERNQVRGGVGLFTGRPAYVWLGNAFQNSGSIGVSLLTCNNSRTKTIAPAFNSTNVTTPPTQCTDGTTARAGSEIDLLQPGLKFPQNLRASLGYDRRVGDSWIATVEGMYTLGINGLFYRNIALSGVATGVPVGIDVAHGGRWIYGNSSGSGSGSPALVAPGVRSQIYDVSNQSKDHAYQLTGQLQRRFSNNYEGSVAYTYSRVWDAMSFTSSTAISQYRFGRAWAFNENDPTPTRSIFEQRHKIVAQGTYTFPTKTDLTVYYIGASGTPYDYVVNGDPNGDGTTLNDPVYVPRDVYNPNDIQLTAYTVNNPDGTKSTISVADQQRALNDFINSTPCLRENRGKIVPRNSCDNPWTNIVNVSARQSLKTIGMQNVSVELQVFNFLNLVNKNWGLQPSAGFGSQALLTMRGRSGADLVNGQPIYSFDPKYQKFLSNNIYSVYQLQLQAKYSF